MHRGSSKGVPTEPGAPEPLPLSASTGPITVTLCLTRGRAVERLDLTVARGTLVRAALRSAGRSPEGSAVLLDDVPIPLDTPIDRALELTVIPTFSGG